MSSKYIQSSNAFAVEDVEKELGVAFKREGIPIDEIPHFLIATAVILAGRSCEIVPGFQVTVRLSIGQTRYVELGDMPSIESVVRKYVKMLPDGDLRITVFTPRNADLELPGIALDLLDTKFDTGLYFDRKLIEVDAQHRPRLCLERPLAFERNATPMVFPIANDTDVNEKT